MTFNYGLIGNSETAALVSREGSIDWCCFPRFDSPSVFARLLDTSGGFCKLCPVEKYQVTQRYLQNTNVLITVFKGKGFKLALYDFFPRYWIGERIEKPAQIIRYVKVLQGRPTVRIEFNPKFNYARAKTQIKKQENYLVATSSKQSIYLYSDIDTDKIKSSKPVTLSTDHFLAISYSKKIASSTKESKLLLARTTAYWRYVVSVTSMPNEFKQHIVRSVLALKLLTHDGGAIIAAPTTSLPEVIGSKRNWDYRYCWLRDASFTIDALTKLCHFDEAEKFIAWITKIYHSNKKQFQIVYRVDGRTDLREQVLKNLSGYKNSRPVRIGNKAYLQKQLDIYGEVMEAFYLFFHHYNYAKMQAEHWKLVENMAGIVVREWKQPDSGIWEFRGKKRHFTFSKLMCWVTLDRAIKIASKLGKTGYKASWTKIRKEIRKNIMKNAWSSKMQAFTQSYGSDALDASNLLMPYFGFLDATHPKMKATITASKKHLLKGCFVYRYTSKDDFGIPENAFTICTFWLIDAIFMSGDKKLARKLFKTIMSKANYLGLFSEDINTKTFELSGNFPQAYTHLAIINTATLLSQGHLRRPVCSIKLEMLKE